MAEPEKGPITTADLLATLIPAGQTLSQDLFKYLSINPRGQPVIRDLAGDIATASAVLSTFQESTTKYPIPDSVECVPLLLRTLKREFEKVAKVLEGALSKEDDQDWLDDGEIKPKLRGDPRQVAMQEGMRDVGPMGRVMTTIDDTLSSLAFLGVIAKLAVLIRIKKE
jgi:hypothetical protein